MMGEEIPDHLAKLIDGVDLDAEDAGLVLLAKSLHDMPRITLWWD